MKTPVRRILVFATAGFAHRECRHRRIRAIVGDRVDNRQPRAAVRAIRKRIAITPVRRIDNLREAVRASHGIGHHARLHRTANAWHDTEIVNFGNRHPFMALDRIDPCKRRAFGAQAGQKLLHRPDIATGVDQHAIAVVTDIAAQPAVMREPPHGGPEADTLYQSAHADLLTNRTHWARPAARRMYASAHHALPVASRYMLRMRK